MPYDDSDTSRTGPLASPDSADSDDDDDSLSIREVLQNREFRTLWLGTTISQVGDGLGHFAAVITVLELTGSTTAVAMMALAEALPQVTVGLVAGVFVDRWRRQRVMVVAHVVAAVMALGFLLVRRAEDLWIFNVLFMAEALVATFFSPARNALVPVLVEPAGLMSANALSATTGFIAQAVGAGIGGVLVAWTGSGHTAFALDALSFLLSAIVIAKVRVPATELLAASGGVRATLEQLADGLRLMVRSRALKAVTLVEVAMSVLMATVMVLQIPYLTTIHHVRTEAVGAMDLWHLLGLILGNAALATWAERFSNQVRIGLSVCILGILIVIIGAAPSFWVIIPAAIASGVVIAPLQASVSTLTQMLVPSDHQGRVGSAKGTVFNISFALWMGTAGILGDTLGIRRVFYLAGTCTLLVGIVSAWLLRAKPGAATLRS